MDMAHNDDLDTRAHLLFWKLKETLIEIEATGRRPVVITHPNGMLDSFGIHAAYATTPQVEEIRRNRAHSS